MSDTALRTQLYYPLAVGNQWTYKMPDGSTYTNSVKAVSTENPNAFIMYNSINNNDTQMRLEGDDYLTDSFQAGTSNILLKENAKVGDTWGIKFQANGFDSLLTMTVKESGIQKEVEGKTYSDVMMIEAESKMMMNGNLMSLNFFTQYYYAKGVGLILTTSSAGDKQALVTFELK